MSTVNPQSVYKLFTEVRELPEAERESYLQNQCHDRPDLLEEVRELLSGKDGLLAFLDRGPVIPEETLIVQQAVETESFRDGNLALDERAKSAEFTIGPYHPIEQIGGGGMGIVYRAVQLEPVRREVALKVIKPGLASENVIARFEAERQALAMMDHPHIARVFDGGTTRDGRPYFAMELVRGIPITEYCNLNKLSTLERLKLFRNVCDAVQHAHQKGIIHRDLKPSNIMVTSEDDVPRVKIIDFGIAKALSQPLTDRTLLTGLLFVIGTPMYMSPEQADLLSQDIDIRCDIYSLGVLLYELLAGLMPFEMDTLSASRVDAYLRVIREEEPRRPSLRLSALEQQKLAILCGQRKIDQRHFVKTLKGELDWIVMKAIEKDRSRRYQSARDLSEDIRRYLEGEPVLASPQSTFYRIRKFCRRHQVIMVMSALVALALIIGFSTAVWQAVRATNAEQIAQEKIQEIDRTAGQLAEMLYSERMERAFSHYFEGEYAQADQLLFDSVPMTDRQTDPRGYEWFLLINQPKISHEQLFEMNGIIRALAHQPERNLLAAGNSLGEITLFELANSRTIGTFADRHQGELYDLCFVGESRLASCAADGTVALWEIISQGDRFELQQLQRIQFGDEPIYAVEFDAVHQTLVAAGGKQIVYSIDLDSWEVRHRSEDLGGRIEALRVTPEGGVLVGAANGIVYHLPAGPDVPIWKFEEKKAMGSVKEIDYLPGRNIAAAGQLLGQVTLFDQSSPRAVRFSQTFPADIHSIALTADGNWIAVGGSNGNVYLMPTKIDYGAGFLESETARKRRMRTWNVHQGKIEQLLFLPVRDDPDTLLLVSSARDGSVRASRPFEHRGRFQSMGNHIFDFDFLSDRTLLVSGCGITIHEIKDDLHELFSFGGVDDWCNVRVTMSSREVFLDLNDRAIFRTTRTESREELSTELNDAIWSAREGEHSSKWAVSPDGKILVLNIMFYTEEGAKRHRFEFYRTGEQEPFRTIFDETTRSANDMVFSPDGRLLAIIQNNDIFLHDPLTGEERGVLTGHRDSIRDLEFSPDSRKLASVSNDRKLIYWDLREMRELWSTTAHENRAIAVAFHPTLHTLATAGEDGIIRFWRFGVEAQDPESRLVGVYPLDAGRPEKLAFSPDGRNLLIRHSNSGLTVLHAAPITK